MLKLIQVVFVGIFFWLASKPSYQIWIFFCAQIDILNTSFMKALGWDQLFTCVHAIFWNYRGYFDLANLIAFQLIAFVVLQDKTFCDVE